jgi:hypothetical protein
MQWPLAWTFGLDSEDEKRFKGMRPEVQEPARTLELLSRRIRWAGRLASCFAVNGHGPLQIPALHSPHDKLFNLDQNKHGKGEKDKTNPVAHRKLGTPKNVLEERKIGKQQLE